MDDIYSPRTFFVDVLCFQGERLHRYVGAGFWGLMTVNALFTYLMTH